MEVDLLHNIRSAMTYELEHGRVVERAFLNLPTRVQKAFRDEFQATQERPHDTVEEVDDETYAEYCLSVTVDDDEYEAGLHIDEESKVIIINTIGHTDDITV